MYVGTATIKRGSKTYTRHLLRMSYRENGKVKHKTILNLSVCSEEEIVAIKLALKHKSNFVALVSMKDIDTTLGKSIGAVFVMNEIARNVGVAKALGNSLEAKLALMQVIVKRND